MAAGSKYIIMSHCEGVKRQKQFCTRILFVKRKRNNRIIVIFISYILVFFLSLISVHPIAAEELEDQGNSSSDDSSHTSGPGLPSPEFTWNLKTALENYISTKRDQDFIDANKKNEVSLRLELQYGTSDEYIFSLSDAYFFPTFLNEKIGDTYHYSLESKTDRNLRISSQDSELIFRELYVNILRGKYRIRLGNQIFAWGTADFMNSTSYINPVDLRELVFKDQEELRLGVPSCSGMIFFDNFTMELVFVPVHTASLYPLTGNFWAAKEVEDEYPLIFDDPQEMDSTSKNFGYATRIAGTYEGMDFSVSGYHGPDREQVLVPYGTVIQENQPISVIVQPQSFIVDFVGGDFSWTYEDFVVQIEAAYSPNKSGFIDQDSDYPQNLTFPYDTEKSDFCSYSVGFNYFIPMHKLIEDHGGESLFTVEWYQAKYFNDDIFQPFITDFVTSRFQDSYFDDRVKISLTNVLETRNSGIIWWPQVTYDFQNGFKTELAYISIDGNGEGDVDEDSIFYYYKENDFIMVNFRYEFQ